MQYLMSSLKVLESTFKSHQVPKLEVTPATPLAMPIMSTEVQPPKKLKAGDAPKTPKTFYGAAAASRKTPVLPKTPASTR